MNDTQKKLYELLIKFDSLCKKHGITYYLGGGTALGALRHKGFLPWDDDVDLYITRKNYEKLLDIQDDFFDDDFILVNHMNYPKYGNTLVRCVDTHSTAITRARIADETPKGQFLELFILDPMPKDPIEQEIWKKKHWIYTELLSFAYRVANVRIVKYIDERLYVEYKKRYDLEGKDKILKELENDLFNIAEEDAVEYCSRWGLRYLVYDINWFKEPRYVDFQDTKLPVATFAENVLRFDYGDNWMYIPHVEEQIVHSFADSMTIGYKNFEDDYEQFIDIDAIYESYFPRKDKLLEFYFKNIKYHEFRNSLKKAQIEASIEYNYSLDNDLNEYLKNREYDKIQNFFKVWYDNQFSKSFWSWEQLIDINDDLLFMALLPLLIKGDFSKVRKILLWKEELSVDLQEMYDFVETLRNVYIALDNYDKKDYEIKIKKLKNHSFKFKSDQLDYRKLLLHYEISNCKSVASLYDLKLKAQQLLNDFSANGEIIYLLANIEEKMENKDVASSLYAKALKSTQHGFVRMDIKNRLLSKGENL